MLDLLSEARMLGCKAADALMDPSLNLLPNQGENLEDQGRYRRIVEKPNYLIMTQSNITYPISVVN